VLLHIMAEAAVEAHTEQLLVLEVLVVEVLEV
jgi:hypothetical protein